MCKQQSDEFFAFYWKTAQLADPEATVGKRLAYEWDRVIRMKSMFEWRMNDKTNIQNK